MGRWSKSRGLRWWVTALVMSTRAPTSGVPFLGLSMMWCIIPIGVPVCSIFDSMCLTSLGRHLQIFEIWSLGLAMVALMPMKVILEPPLNPICLHLETIRLWCPP